MKHVLGLLYFLVLSVCIKLTVARFLDITEVTVIAFADTPLDKITVEADLPEVGLQNEKYCGLCESFTSLAVNYLRENRTQEDIIEALHNTCYRLHPLQEQCMVLIDYYAPQFFKEINLFTPDSFCKKVNLCDASLVTLPQKYSNTCSICHQAIDEVLVQLQNPDTKLEIVKTLLKACSKVENYSQQCKKLVFEYAPLILVNAEKFLETTDICTSIHVCKEDEFIQVQQTEPALYEF